MLPQFITPNNAKCWINVHVQSNTLGKTIIITIFYKNVHRQFKKILNGTFCVRLKFCVTPTLTNKVPNFAVS